MSGEAASRKNISTDEKLSIAVFGITEGDAGKKEIEIIAEAVAIRGFASAEPTADCPGARSQSAEESLGHC